MNQRERKALAIKEYLAGGTTSAKLGLKYGFGNASVSRWVVEERKKKEKWELRAASLDAVNEREGMPTDIKVLQEELRIARINICLLEAMIDISDEQFGTDIRKKAGTRPS
jgi:transposase-like protein